MVFVGNQGEIVSSNGSLAGNDFVSTYARICAEHKEREGQWVAELRKQGIKAAHPDDGWVDRKKNTLVFSNPQFRDPVAVDDRVALGTPEKWRIVKVVDITKPRIVFDNSYRIYHFVETESGETKGQ